MTAAPWDHYIPRWRYVAAANPTFDPGDDDSPDDMIVATVDRSENGRGITIMRNLLPSLLSELDAVRKERDEWKAALQGVVDVLDPNGDHYYWRKKKEDVAATVRFVVEGKEAAEDDAADVPALRAALLEACDGWESAAEDAREYGPVPIELLEACDGWEDAEPFCEETAEDLARLRAVAKGEPR
jgi:hypothetical protein